MDPRIRASGTLTNSMDMELKHGQTDLSTRDILKKD